MVIYNNMPAKNALRILQGTEWNLQKTMERLNSGLKINRAADDASGYAISESMRGQIRGMAAAQKNNLDSISMLQVADAAFASTLDLLHRMNELAISAANGDKTDAQRVLLDDEFQALLDEIITTGAQTKYNSYALLDGSITTITFQIGPDTNQSFGFAIGSLTDASLTLTGIAISDQIVAMAAIVSIQDAINGVTVQNAKLGAVQNRLQYSIGRLGVIAENIQAAESRYRDADMSVEVVNFTRLQILQQSGTAMLAQANLAPQSVLQLLR